ncbi:MAG: ABC transporter permease [Lentisphaerae bacterium]|nr:ABC transporter permease [Lentisphaerota bacterium]
MLKRARSAIRIFAILWTTLTLAVRPRYWPRTVRGVLARQLLFSGVEALPFIALVALITGVAVVVQAQLWLGKAGQSALLGPILVMVIIREVAPLLVNFIVISRSGTAIATELASMKVHGEIRVLEAAGLDPLLYLAMPRSVGMALAVFCLTLAFIAISFASGYLCGILIGVGVVDPQLFLDSILKDVHGPDMFNLLAKTLLPGMLTSIICIQEGLSVQRAITEVPQAATRAVVRSISALFIVSVIISILSYLR